MSVIDIPDTMLAPAAPGRRPGDFYRDAKGTPQVTDPVKRRKDGQPWTVYYGRPSSFGKQIENTYNLEKWSERQVALGIAHGVDCTPLLPADQESREWRSLADGIVVAAKREAKAMLAAERGTHTHLLTELDDEGKHWLVRAEDGEELGIPTDVQAALVAAWRSMLADLGLEIVASEATVVNDRWRLAGTLDRIARLTRALTFTTAQGELVTLDAGTTIVLDIKTGKLTADEAGYPIYWHTYAVQVCAYADAVPYDPDSGLRGEWVEAPHSEWAIIAHLDVLAALEGEATCTPILVDINAGRMAGDLCHAAKQWQKRNDLFGRLHRIEGEPCTTTSPTTTATASSSTTATSPPAPTSTPDTNSSTSPSSQPETPSNSASAGTTHTSTPACSRDALRARIAELIAAGHEALIRAHWPHGVAPLSKLGHTADDLALILTAVRRVESDVSWPFRPDDGTVATPTRKGSTWPDTTTDTTLPLASSTSTTDAATSCANRPTSTSSPTPSSSSETPSSTETTSDSTTESDPEDMPPASPAVTDESPPRPAPQLPDEGGDVDPATVAALQAAFAALPDAARQAIGVISAEANAAGRPISVTQSPTLRRWSIARALVRWGRLGEARHLSELWFCAGDLLDSSQVTDDDTTLGALIGALTIDQANALADTFDITVAA